MSDNLQHRFDLRGLDEHRSGVAPPGLPKMNGHAAAYISLTSNSLAPTSMLVGLPVGVCKGVLIRKELAR